MLDLYILWLIDITPRAILTPRNTPFKTATNRLLFLYIIHSPVSSFRIHDHDFPSLTHSAKPLLISLISANPTLCSKPRYGFPPKPSSRFFNGRAFSFSMRPAHTRHWMGLRSGAPSTIPTQSSSTETRVSSTISAGRVMCGSSADARGAGGVEAGRRENS